MAGFLSVLSVCLYLIGFFLVPWWLGVPMILAGAMLGSVTLAALIEAGR